MKGVLSREVQSKGAHAMHAIRREVAQLECMVDRDTRDLDSVLETFFEQSLATDKMYGMFLKALTAAGSQFASLNQPYCEFGHASHLVHDLRYEQLEQRCAF